MADGAKKNSGMILLIAGIVVITGAILTFFFWYKPTYMDKKDTKKSDPPKKVEVDLADNTIIKNLANANTEEAVAKVLNAA